MHALVILCGVVCGCTKTWTAEATQPPLIMGAGAVARTSLPLEIVYRDMESGFYRISNRAVYVVVSRDRLRFHLTLHHKWDDFADFKNWTAYVIDAKGKRHRPEHVSTHVERVASLKINGATYWMNQLMFRGTANVTIYDRDLLDAGSELTLVMTKGNLEYRYHWVTATEDPEESFSPGRYDDGVFAIGLDGSVIQWLQLPG